MWAKAGVVGNSLELSTAAAVRASASSTSPQRGCGLVVGLAGAPIALSPGACELEPQHCASALCRLYSAQTVVGTYEFAFDRRGDDSLPDQGLGGGRVQRSHPRSWVRERWDWLRSIVIRAPCEASARPRRRTMRRCWSSLRNCARGARISD